MNLLTNKLDWHRIILYNNPYNESLNSILSKPSFQVKYLIQLKVVS